MYKKRRLIVSVLLVFSLLGYWDYAFPNTASAELSIFGEDIFTSRQGANAISNGSSEHDSSEDLFLLVDFQNAYLPDNVWACPTIYTSMTNTIKILNAPEAPDYLMTKFMAPSNPSGRWVQYNSAYASINASSYLCDIPSQLKPFATEGKVIEKSTYSSLDSSEVLAALEGKKTVVLAGVEAECCILATMMDAIDLGYKVIYLYDCISGKSSGNENMIKQLAKSFSSIHTEVMSCNEYLASISSSKGWTFENGVWHYYDKYGIMFVNKWLKSSNRWFYFGPDGTMVTGFQTIDGKQNFFDDSGRMQSSAWAHRGSDWVYCKASGELATDWQKINGKWYYFDESGLMVKGTQVIDGTTYVFDNSGAMRANTWVEQNSKWSYLTASGV